jgi:hypothetical protein
MESTRTGDIYESQQEESKSGMRENDLSGRSMGTVILIIAKKSLDGGRLEGQKIGANAGSRKNDEWSEVGGER